MLSSANLRQRLYQTHYRMEQVDQHSVVGREEVERVAKLTNVIGVCVGNVRVHFDVVRVAIWVAVGDIGVGHQAIPVNLNKGVIIHHEQLIHRMTRRVNDSQPNQPYDAGI